jgi:hypothetical protein
MFYLIMYDPRSERRIPEFLVTRLSVFLKSFELPHRKLNPKENRKEMWSGERIYFGDDLTSHEISDHSIHHSKAWRRRESQFSSTHHSNER